MTISLELIISLTWHEMAENLFNWALPYNTIDAQISSQLQLNTLLWIPLRVLLLTEYKVYSTYIFSENSTMFVVTKNDWNKLFPMISSPSLDSDLVSNLSASGKNSDIYNINFQSIVCQLHFYPTEKFFLKVTKKLIVTNECPASIKTNLVVLQPLALSVWTDISFIIICLPFKVVILALRKHNYSIYFLFFPSLQGVVNKLDFKLLFWTMTCMDLFHFSIALILLVKDTCLNVYKIFHIKIYVFEIRTPNNYFIRWKVERIRLSQPTKKTSDWTLTLKRMMPWKENLPKLRIQKSLNLPSQNNQLDVEDYQSHHQALYHQDHCLILHHK